MLDVKDNFGARESRRTGPLVCQPLLDIATPGIFQINAFRITGLRVDATTREITKNADRLKIMEELGRGEGAHAGAFPLSNPPTVDQIREASQRLKDPEHRIIDEFFWFWPKQFGQSESDPAIRAIECGDPDTAFKIWSTLETSPEGGVVAMHNIAVLWHLLALEWESHPGNSLSEEKKRETEKYWRNAFKRWELLAVDDLFWQCLSDRIKQVNDPRLSTEFARRMRATFPDALDKINAELAVQYAESGHSDMAERHIKFMRETNQGLDSVEKTAELVLAPVVTRLKTHIQGARRRAAETPSDAGKAGQELLLHARRALALFGLFFGKESQLRNELSDEVAASCNQLQVTYHKATGDNNGCLDLLREVLPFASSIELRRQIEENMATLTGNLNFKKLAPLYALLEELQKSNQVPSIRLERFKKEAVVAISMASTNIPGSEAEKELADSAAIVLRTIALAAWNTHQDIATSLAATQLAVQYARESELTKQLEADQSTLLQIVAQRTAQEAARKSSRRNQVLAVLGFVGLLALIGVFSSGTSPSRSTGRTSPIVTPPRYVAPTSLSTTSTTHTPPLLQSTPLPRIASDDRLYRVPQSRTAELERDSREVEAAKARAAQFSVQLERLATTIESDRLLLNRYDQFEVDSFNVKLNRYNSMLRQGKALDREANRLVDEYNAKLKLYGR